MGRQTKEFGNAFFLRQGIPGVLGDTGLQSLRNPSRNSGTKTCRMLGLIVYCLSLGAVWRWNASLHGWRDRRRISH